MGQSARPGVSYILVLFNLAIRFPSALYVLEAFRIHIRYMRIGCMQSTLLPILMTMLIWNDLMDSQHDNLSRGSPRLMTSDRQILFPHQSDPNYAFDTLLGIPTGSCRKCVN